MKKLLIRKPKSTLRISSAAASSYEDDAMEQAFEGLPVDEQRQPRKVAFEFRFLQICFWVYLEITIRDFF
jgi:hypothetical protein